MSQRARKRPCRFCRKWFLPDSRVGTRQRSCSGSDCQRKRRAKTQASWRERNPEYFIARRITERSGAEEPCGARLPVPLSKLPWDLAQDQFGIQGADFIGVMGKLLHGHAQDQCRAYLVDSLGETGGLRPAPRKDQFQAVPR